MAEQQQQKHYAKWKEPGTRDYILYITMWIKFLEKPELQRQKAYQWLCGNGKRDWWEPELSVNRKGWLKVLEKFKN